jgi:hypothetical protein
MILKQRRAYTDLERMLHRLFTKLGKLSIILSKDQCKKLMRGSRVLYAQKIEQAETAEGRNSKES